MFQNFQFKVFFEVSFDMNGGKEEAAKLVKSHLLKRNCRVGKHNILSLISHLQEPLCHSLLGKVRKHKRKAIQLLECLKSMLFYKLVCTKCKVPRRAICDHCGSCQSLQVPEEGMWQRTEVISSWVERFTAKQRCLKWPKSMSLGLCKTGQCQMLGSGVGSFLFKNCVWSHPFCLCERTQGDPLEFWMPDFKFQWPLLQRTTNTSVMHLFA